MKEPKHEVIFNGELNTSKIEKKHIDSMCRSLLKDVLGYYHKVNNTESPKHPNTALEKK